MSEEHTSAPIAEPEGNPFASLRIRAGTGANCSSVGSVVDTLFAAAAVGTALVAAVLVALRKEPVEIVGENAVAEDNFQDGEKRPHTPSESHGEER